MGSGARSGSDGPTSVEAGRRVGASMKSRLAQPPRIVDVFGALRPSVRARWVHGTRSETMAILVKELQGVTKRLRAFP